MFALTGLDKEEFEVNLKCDPDRAVELREEFDGIRPGWHMNKTHWNTVTVHLLDPKLVIELTRHSYDLVVASLKKADREALKKLSGE